MERGSNPRDGAMEQIELIEYCRKAVDNVKFYHPKLTNYHKHLASFILVDWHNRCQTPYPFGWYADNNRATASVMSYSGSINPFTTTDLFLILSLLHKIAYPNQSFSRTIALYHFKKYVKDRNYDLYISSYQGRPYCL